MNCTEARRRIEDSLAATREDAALAAHLRSCAACARVRSAHLALSVALAALPEEEPGAGFDAAVLAALAGSRPAVPAWVFPAASALLAAWTGALAWGAARVWAAASAARAGVAAAELLARARLALDVAALLLPAPPDAARFSAAVLLAAAVLLSLSAPSVHLRPLGERK